MGIEWILAAVAFLLALAFDLIPGMKAWWDKLPEMGKRWGWLIGCLLVPIAVWAVACYYPPLNLWGFEAECSVPGVIQSLVVGFSAYWVAQAGHGLGKVGEARLYG